MMGIRGNSGFVGDIDCDGSIDVGDLISLVGAWGTCAGECDVACPGDLDGNCEIDAVDVLILIANWS